MSQDQTFRLVLLVGALILLPVMVYHRLRSQATGEKLDPRQEGLFILFTGGLVVVLLVVRVPTEEEKLLLRFGGSYRTYLERTGRFLLKISSL